MKKLITVLTIIGCCTATAQTKIIGEPIDSAYVIIKELAQYCKTEYVKKDTNGTDFKKRYSWKDRSGYVSAEVSTIRKKTIEDLKSIVSNETVSNFKFSAPSSLIMTFFKQHLTTKFKQMGTYIMEGKFYLKTKNYLLRIDENELLSTVTCIKD